MRSGYSARENNGETIQTRGTENPSIARTSRITSSRPLRSVTTVTPRLRWPCGARIATITTLAARITAFAIHGFIAADQPLLKQGGTCVSSGCPANYS